jgi:hypothetical protein
MSDRYFEGVQLSDEALEGISGGLLDLFDNSEPISITAADFVKAAKEHGQTLEQAKAEMLDFITRLNALTPLFTEAETAAILAEMVELW